MALTDDELIELAKKELESDNDLHDVWYYQQQHYIIDGIDPVYTKHLYFHYKNWSIDPVTCEVFVDFLKLNNKNTKNIFLDKSKCLLTLEKLIGDYVKTQRKSEKEARFRKISSSKS